MDKTTLVLVSCASQKLATAAPAGQLYTSQLFRAARTYAQRVGDAWGILSAKHGIAWPDEMLEPYDCSLVGAGRDRKRQWSSWVQCGIAAWLADRPHLMHRPGKYSKINPSALRVVVLAGRHYVDSLPSSLQSVVETPLAGLGVGHRLQWFAQQNAGQAVARQSLLF